MKVKINILKIVFISTIFSVTSYCQAYFPLEIGNRWDYSITVQSHGGNFSYSKLSVEIIGKTIFNNNKEYYVFSNKGLFNSEYIRMGNDSLFYFNKEDSTDCLIFAFDQSLGSSYYSCKYDTVIFMNKSDWTIFSQPDSQQYHVTHWIAFEFSKKFGMINSDDWSGILSERWYNLSGCIISGITYGILLSIEENITNKIYNFQLNQNYPNPFNPSTTIIYQIPKEEIVTIKIYDLLGREITTLVNEEKPAGEYEVKFDATNVSSGIYYYKIKAGEYVETKKMIVLK